MAKKDEGLQKELQDVQEGTQGGEPADEGGADAAPAADEGGAADAPAGDDGGGEPAADDSARGRFLARLKGKYPDESFDNDDAVYERAGKDYDDYEKRLGDYAAREKGFSDLFTGNPVLARMYSDIQDNPDDDAEMYFVRRFGDSLKDIIDDPAKQEQVARNNKKWAAKIAKEKEYNEQYRKNIDASLTAVDKMKADGMTTEDKDNALDLLDEWAHNIVIGIYTPEMVQMALHAMKHDDDVEKAKAQGLVDGRNEKIKETLHKPAQGDGLPVLGGRSGGLPKEEPSVPGALGSYGSERQDIFTRGGEKRRRNNG